MNSTGKAILEQAQEQEEKIITISEKSPEEKLYESLKKYELPDYLLYTGAGGANNWLKLDGSRTFPVARQLKIMLEENVASIVRFIPACMSLVSVGVGSGEKERILLEELIKKNRNEKPESEKVSIRYYPVDINSQLVDLALEKVKDLPVEKKGIVGLIEDMPLLKKHWHLPVLFCILGNTFCNYEPEFILKLVHENLEQGDLFFFDANLLPTQGSGEEAQAARKSILGTYASRENMLFNMYPLLHYGMAPEDFDFELLLAQVDSRIGALCRTRKSLNILKDSEIRIGEETISFKEGDVIRMGFTYKYTYDQVLDFLDICGFDVLKDFLSEDRTNVMVLAKKRI
ncbi:L-histidine N(alpha)-methyltransferase [Methanosarcina sp. T3]|uniref:L-histidine N(alpha)-methyltransferase n=1 Tax=Methanosarcina sp. T3 TaxID=3439062 RepID=UPI003F85F384